MAVSDNVVLVEIVTAANMAGVDQAKAGFAHFNPALIGLTLGLGVLGAMGKSVVDNTEAQEVATKNLAQAYGYLKEAVPTKEIQNFIDQNAQFLPSMFAAENGFASLARAGFNNTTQLRLMNDALDLSVAKGIPLEDAVATLTKGSLGLSRGLMDLGISQKDINAAMGKGATEGQKFEELLRLLEPKIKHEREDTSDLGKATHSLNIEWEKLSSNGQPLPELIATITNKLTDLLKFLSTSDAVNGPDGFFAQLQNAIIATITFIEILIKDWQNLMAFGTIDQPGNFGANKPLAGHPSKGRGYRLITTP